MLYMTGSDTTIIVLESANLDELRKGRPAKTPDGKVLIAWTPDPVWLAEQIANSGGDGALIGRLIDEAALRPEKPKPGHHPTHVTEFVKKEFK